MIDLIDIENKLEEALKKETTESWLNFLIKERLEAFIGNGKLFDTKRMISGSIEDKLVVSFSFELNHDAVPNTEYKKSIASIYSKVA